MSLAWAEKKGRLSAAAIHVRNMIRPGADLYERIVTASAHEWALAGATIWLKIHEFARAGQLKEVRAIFGTREDADGETKVRRRRLAIYLAEKFAGGPRNVDRGEEILADVQECFSHMELGYDVLTRLMEVTSADCFERAQVLKVLGYKLDGQAVAVHDRTKSVQAMAGLMHSMILANQDWSPELWQKSRDEIDQVVLWILATLRGEFTPAQASTVSMVRAAKTA